MSETKIDLNKMTLEEIASYVQRIFKSPFPSWKKAFDKLNPALPTGFKPVEIPHPLANQSDPYAEWHRLVDETGKEILRKLPQYFTEP